MDYIMCSDTMNIIKRNDGSSLKVGDRITCHGFKGSVKFIGEVPPTTGNWLGIDWDHEKRGKHNGSKDGITYFQTKYETSGSFVRPDKVDLGISCLEAIKSRYGKSEDDTGGVNEDDLYVMDSSRKIKLPVLMFGAKKLNEKQSQLDQLKQAVLTDMSVYGSSGSHLIDACLNISELNLSRNLLSDWLDVISIAKQLLHLHTLDVSGNKMALVDNPRVYRSSFSKLRTVVMKELGLTWSQILHICEMMPALENLCVAMNGMSELSVTNSDQLSQLRYLDIQGNHFKSWSEVLNIGTLAQLTDLVASDIGISEIKFPDKNVGGKTNYFSNLTYLSLQNNDIHSWASIDELDKLRSLNSLKILNNPLNLSDKPSNIRCTIIAKIGNLCILNQSFIDRTERKGSEYEYLKDFYNDWLQNNKLTNDSSIASHPRIPILIEKYGLSTAECLAFKAPDITNKLISLMITDGEKEIQKKLPPSMRIWKLRNLVQKLFKSEGEADLWYNSKQAYTEHLDIGSEMKDLSYYSMEDGDTIFVNCFPHS